MRRTSGRLAIILALALLALGSTAQAGSITFIPSDSDMGDLDHGYYYIWGIKGWQKPVGQEITSAVFSISNVNNWDGDTNDLWIHLLGDPAIAGWWYNNGTVTQYSDAGPNIPYGDQFAGQGLLLGHFQDTNGPSTPDSLQYAVPSNYFGWLTDGRFGFGIDPDCHFYNNGIQFQIQTAPPTVPEPTSLLLLGTGLVGLGRALRRKKA